MPKLEDKPVIAVDIDEVLAAHAKEFIAHSNQTYGTSIDIESYMPDWLQLWGVSKEEVRRRWRMWRLSGVFGRLAIIEGADEALRSLSRSHELVVVTARHIDISSDTHEWIDRHHPGVFRDVRLVPVWDDPTATKAQVCEELGAEYLIDDQVDHVNLAANSGIKGLLFGDYSWNRHEPVEQGVVRVANWQAVLEQFNV